MRITSILAATMIALVGMISVADAAAKAKPGKCGTGNYFDKASKTCKSKM
jgi:hypothetical protein